jgi:uncharacterized protein YndB with AHSA1/START domain
MLTFAMFHPMRREAETVASTTISASITIKASAEAIFAVLVDPASHAAIDGTGWVRDPVDRQILTAPGQIFRMAMYHPDHPDGNYETANRVEVFEPPHSISWATGSEPGDGNLQFGGWIWRYDLSPLGPSETELRLTYNWSAVPEDVVQRHGGFPSFPPEHLDSSLIHLSGLVLP